jgi:hypothetical protein
MAAGALAKLASSGSFQRPGRLILCYMTVSEDDPKDGGGNMTVRQRDHAVRGAALGERYFP